MFSRRRLLIGCAAVLILGAALVLYLSWVPDSRMALIPWMPHWLGAWADDSRENSRTAYPLVMLGAITGVWLILNNAGRRLMPWIASWGALIAIVAIAELGQLWIPRRDFTFEDIGWGALGAGAGLLLIGSMRLAANGLRRSFFRSSRSDTDQGTQ